MRKKIVILLLMFLSFVTMVGCENLPTGLSGLTTEETTSGLTSENLTTDSEVTSETPTTSEDVTTSEDSTTEELTTEAPTTVESTTELPSTEVPTTEVPTTELPTTEVPTTEAPTTEDVYYDDYVDLSSVHLMKDDTDVTVSGVVYFLTQNGYYIQDNTGNLFIFTNSAPTVDLGDRVVINGTLTTYREVKQIGDSHTLVEVNARNQNYQKQNHSFTYGITDVQPGQFYTITGEVRIEGTYDTAYLYEGNTKIAEIYYQSIENSVNAIKAYEGEIITVDLLYYAMGDEVERYAFQGSQSDISVEIPDDAEALLIDADLLPTDQTLRGNIDFGQGFYGSVYTIDNVSGLASDFVTYEGAYLNVVRPGESVGDVTGVLTMIISLNDETPITRTINITIKAEGSSTSLAYYDAAEGLTGTALLSALHVIINDGFNQMTYDDAKWVLEEADRDPNNSNNVILVYLRDSVKGEWDSANEIWNREHVWPQSKFDYDPGIKADMHNLKPSDYQENSYRGNKPFGEVSSSSTYEPPQEVKGDIARILFYMSVMYNQLDVTSGIVGNMDMLLDWNEMDPVDDFEMNRNEVIYQYQGNRNPFIDNPEYANLIWG